MSTVKKNTLDQLHKELIEATVAYEDAEQKLSFARNYETDARNRMNNAQKAFDGHVDELKKGAPQGSDWGLHRSVGG